MERSCQSLAIGVRTSGGRSKFLNERGGATAPADDPNRTPWRRRRLRRRARLNPPRWVVGR
eukprot:6391975-Pyramimonas_sp.AAC.1